MPKIGSDTQNRMGKKIGMVLLVALIAFGLGVWFYESYLKHAPAPSVAPGNAETSRIAPPPAGAAATSENAVAPGAPEGVRGTNVQAPPFKPRSGEVLEFAANVTKLNSTVANLQVKVGERRSLAGENALHLQAFAHTENPYRMVFQLDDQFDSYSDVSNLTSLQYEMHLSERGQKTDTVERILPAGADPAPPDAAAARVLPGTRDPIGMLMYLRGTDWSQTREARSPVYDGHRLYDVRAVLLGRNEDVSVAAGKFTATEIEIHVLDNGTEMKNAHFLLYISETPGRLPVLMEAVLPVMTVRVELTKVR